MFIHACVCVCAAFKKIGRIWMRDDVLIPDMAPMAVAMKAAMPGLAAKQAPAARELCCCYYAFNTLIMHGSGLQVLSPERLQMIRTFEIILGRSVKQTKKEREKKKKIKASSLLLRRHI